MAMGKKGKRDRQASMWVATADLPKSAGHPFYAQLNRVLDDAGFDTFVEAQCAQFLCRRHRAAESGAGALFPIAAARLF